MTCVNVLVFGASKTNGLTNSEIWRRDKEKATESFDSIALVPHTRVVDVLCYLYIYGD